MTGEERSAAACPCGSGSSYGECCRPLHLGSRQAATAEQLMRSRFTAFCFEEVDYLIATRSAGLLEDRKSLLETIAGTRWTGLEILQVRAGGALDPEGEVEFIAAFRDRATGAPGRLHERSRFAREQGRWRYVDGDRPEKSGPQAGATARPGRNDPCWCGSGRKFKKCHGR